MMVEKKLIQNAYMDDNLFSWFIKLHITDFINLDDHFSKNDPIGRQEYDRIFKSNRNISYSDYIFLMRILYEAAEKDQQDAIRINRFFEWIIDYSKEGGVL